MHRFALLLAACSSATTSQPTTPEVEPARAEVTTTCTESRSGSFVEWTLDADGLPSKQYANADASGSQWSTNWVRDERGRTTRLRIEMLEGMGDGDQTRDITIVENEDGSVERRWDEFGELIRERWVYDQHGRPTRRELRRGDAEPRVDECVYDESGRLASRNGSPRSYVGDTPILASSFRDVVLVTDPYQPPYTHGGEVVRFTGDCSDVVHWPCSPVFAPPPPGRERAERLPTAERRSYPSIEALLDAELCVEDSECTESIEHASHAGSELRGVAVATIARGDSESQSTHLLLHLSDGWWAGPQLADGPFNGNQMSGTLQFEISDVQLQQVVPGDDPELVARYRTQTSHEVEEQQHDVEESGLLICIELASQQLACTRAVERIREEVDGEAAEAHARLRIVGDGTIAVDEVEGSHERVQSETFPIEYLFGPY